MNKVKQLERFGQSVWLDSIRRDLLTSGKLGALIAGDGVKGLTSNPAVFEKAIAAGAEYQGALAAAARAGEHDPERIYERFALEDIRMAADQMTPIYDQTWARDGYVGSCPPRRAGTARIERPAPARREVAPAC